MFSAERQPKTADLVTRSTPMVRVIFTNSFPVFPDHIDEGTEVVALGSALPSDRLVNRTSLATIARKILVRNGYAIAPASLSRHHLKKAIFRVAPEADVSSLYARTKRILTIVLRTGIDLELLTSKGSQRVRQLALIAAEYKKRLRRHGLVDRSETLLVASRLVAEKRKMLVFGYFRARKEELLLIDALAGEGSVYYLPCGADPMFHVNQEAVKLLVASGWEVSDASGRPVKSVGSAAAARFAGISDRDPNIAAITFPHIDQEVRSTLAAVKRLVRQGVAPEQIALVSRDMKRYARPVGVIADEYGLPVQLNHTIPLETTGFGGFITALLEAVDRDFAFEPTARMVMHPFGPGLPEKGIADARRKRITGLAGWCEICPLVQDLNDGREKPLVEWTENLRSAAELLGARERAMSSTAEWLGYQGFFDVLATTARVEKGRAISFQVFLSIINETLKEESVPMRPRRGGIQMLLPEEMVGATFDHVFVIGLAEGVFPKPPREDPVMDFFERRLLRNAYNVQFASASEVAHWEELSFYFTLLAAQKKIVLSYSRLLDNAELVASAFFSRLGFTAEEISAVSEPESISSVEEARRLMLRQPILAFEDGLDAARRHFRVELGRETGQFYDEYDGVIGVPIDPASRVWSASQITTIGQCSFRWFAGRLLHLSPIEEMKTGLDGGTRGRLYHKALEIAVSRSIGSADVRASVLEILDDAFAEAEKDEKVKLPVLPNWEAERREQLKGLRKAVESAEFILSEANVLGVEREFRAKWEGFPLRGTIDRIDEAPGGLIAIDYKTSAQMPKGAKDPWGKLSVDVQIPIYSRVALPKLYPGEPIGTSLYYSLTKGRVLRSEQEDDIGKLGELAQFLHVILAKGSFAVDPDLREKACTYCDFATVCRKGPRLRRKRRSG